MASENAYTTDTLLKALEPLLGEIYTVANATDIYITRAERIINAELSSRYSVPFTTVPYLVITMTELLAAYFGLKSKFAKDSVNKNDWVITYKDDYEDLLKRIMEEGTQLVDSDGIVAIITDTISSNSENWTPIFNVDDPKNWRVDPDKLEAIKDSK